MYTPLGNEYIILAVVALLGSILLLELYGKEY